MSQETPPLFGKTKFIEGQIDEFLDKISEGGMYFEMAFTSYLENSCLTESCDNKLQQLIEVKKRCNDLRRLIATELYTEMLIPDHRGDVLRLIQDLYSLIDDIADDFQELLIEKPEILP